MLPACISYQGVKAEHAIVALEEMAGAIDKLAEGGGKPSAKELERLEASELERREALPKLRAGMTVDVLRKLMPHTFDRKSIRELKKSDAFVGSLDGYKLHFSRGILTEIDAPVDELPLKPSGI